MPTLEQLERSMATRLEFGDYASGYGSEHFGFSERETIGFPKIIDKVNGEVLATLSWDKNSGEIKVFPK